MKNISYARDKFIPTNEVSLNVLGNFLSVVRGYQVFTFLKTVNKGKPVFLDYHLDRVLNNAKSMNMIVKQSRQEIEQLVQDTLNQNSFDVMECNIIILLAGTKPIDASALITDMPIDLFIIITPIKVYSSESYQKGIALGLFEYERPDGELKTPFTYFGGLKAQHAVVRNAHYDEALYTSNNMILEGTTFSFFGIMDDGTIITSPADGKILKSVTRLVLLDLLKKEELKVLESHLSIEKALACKEAFIVSANRDVIPVTSIEGHALGNGVVGEHTKSIMGLYQDLINSIH
jgi:D-alanine transaminase|tara:strand:+ start:431 stop:1300 length:870 start_codon:yes stop_codon:yes gene_type:complete